MEINHSTTGNPYCYPMYASEKNFDKGNIFAKLKKLELAFDFFLQPLDADIILANFGDEGMQHYEIIKDIETSRGKKAISLNGRVFDCELCIGDFVGLLWMDGIKLRLSNWALYHYYYEPE